MFMYWIFRLGSDDELSTTDEDTDNDEISITNPSTSKVDDSNTTKIDNNIASNSNSNSSDVTPKDLSPMNQNKDENLQEPEVKMSNEIQPEERGK